MKRRECFIPAREVNWKKYAYLRNRENNIFYDCECGKRYISFPAIYLHFQRKHNRKLAGKQESMDYQVRRSQSELVYFYFADGKALYSTKSEVTREGNFQENVAQSHLALIFSDFLRQNHRELSGCYKLSYFKKVLSSLQSFINSQEKATGRSQNHYLQTIEILPLYFNEFAMYETGQGKFKNQKEYSTFCFMLFLLCKWLNGKGYSSIQLEFNMERLQGPQN